MAQHCGLSPATVQRIWDAHGLQPHRLRQFKLSRDPQFVEKLTDVVGLYLNPPDKALVVCVERARLGRGRAGEVLGWQWEAIPSA